MNSIKAKPTNEHKDRKNIEEIYRQDPKCPTHIKSRQADSPSPVGFLEKKRCNQITADYKEHPDSQGADYEGRRALYQPRWKIDRMSGVRKNDHQYRNRSKPVEGRDATGLYPHIILYVRIGFQRSWPHGNATICSVVQGGHFCTAHMQRVSFRFSTSSFKSEMLRPGMRDSAEKGEKPNN